MIKYFDINDRGHSIRCKLFCNDQRSIDDVILCGHGFAGHKDNKSTERFAETVLSKYKTVAVLTFDWPAHGKDVKKRLLLSDCDEYITVILDYITSEMNVKKLQGYANSFGGYMFLKYIHDHGNPFSKLALRSPAITIYESVMNKIIDADGMELISKGKDAAVGFDRKTNINKQFLDELKDSDVRKYEYLDEFEKIMVIHGTADEMIDFDAVKSFADDNLMEFIPVEGADHRFQNYAAMGNAIRDIITFLEL